MTALREYERLESGGLWRAEADAQRREVTVSFGDATLVISDTAGRPLTHWSLAAVQRQNPGTRPAIFTPAPDADEALEIEDDLMVDAIEKVRKTVAKSRPRKGKLRGLGTVTLIAAVAALVVFWLPGALHRQALSVVPQTKRIEIGAAILGHLQSLTGPVCRGDLGRAALGRLQSRVLGRDTLSQIVVMPLDQDTALPLPGGIIVLDRAVIERLDDPAIAAGFILAADTTRSRHDPLSPILAQAGFANTLRLLTTGDIPPDVLAAHAVTLIGDQAADLDSAALLPAFAQARIPSTPFGQHLQAQGVAADALLTADPVAADDVPMVISDSDWVSLQGICDS